MPTTPRPVRLLQLSDTHLFAAPAQTLYGVDCGPGLQAVLAHIQGRRTRADALLVTGDLVQDYADEAYRRLYRLLGDLGLPTYVIPGNHDNPEQMRRTLLPPVSAPRTARHGAWELVLLDSRKAGSEGGELGSDELAALDQALGASEAPHALVCLHHNPCPTGSRWLDSMTLADAESFFALLDRHPRVRGVTWGHVHQASEEMRRGVRLFGTPSTCVQFSPHSPEFAVSPGTVGYRWFDLHADGRIDSAVEWLRPPN